MPGLVWVAGGMWAGATWAEAAVWERWCGGRPWALIALACGAGALCAIAVRVRAARALAAGIVVGAVASACYGLGWMSAGARVRDAGACEWRGVVVGDAQPGAWGTYVRVRLSGGAGSGWLVGVAWPEGTAVPEMGERVAFGAVFKAAEPARAGARTRARAGEIGSGSAWTARSEGRAGGVGGAILALRAEVRRRLDRVRGPGGDLMCGVLLGDRRRVADTPLADDFRSLGLSHLLAVSGDHLAIACVAAAAVLTALGAGRRTRLAGTVAAGAVFAVLTGLQMSALRAMAMLATGTVVATGGRRTDPAGALAAAAIALVTERPWCVFDMGLRLSVLAVAGLAVFGGLAAWWVRVALGGMERVSAPVAMTLVAQAATAAVALPAFGMFSPIAPLANAIVVPLVSAGLVAGLAAVVLDLASSRLGTIALSAASLPMRGAAEAAAILARAPGAAVPVDVPAVVVWAVVAASASWLWVRWPRPRRAGARRTATVVAVLSAALAAGPPAIGASVTVLDVGQGDAVLVRDGGRTMLVDTGPDGASLRRALGRHGVRAIDVLVLTHAHDDHTGGAEGLAGVVPVGWVGVPGVVAAGDEGGAVEAPESFASDGGAPRALTAGDRWRLGRTEVTVVWPRADARPERENDRSVVLHLRRGAFDAVLTGDAEADPQRAIVAGGLSGPAEVLKVPHHGSVNGLGAEGLALWRPAAALVSVGAGNRFGHPDAEVVGMLETSGARVLRTDRNGDLVVSVGRDGFRVRTGRRLRAERACARIRRAAREVAAATGPTLDGDARAHGIGRVEGPQAGLPDMGCGGVAARGGRGPPPSAAREGRGPRLQPPRLRRGDRRRRRDPQRCQHAAVHVGAQARRGQARGAHERGSLRRAGGVR